MALRKRGRENNNLNAAKSVTCLSGLFLEGVQDTINKLLLQFVIYVCGTKVTHDFLNGLHHHFSVLLSFILQVIHDTGDNLSCPYFIGQFHCSVY